MDGFFYILLTYIPSESTEKLRREGRKGIFLGVTPGHKNKGITEGRDLVQIGVIKLNLLLAP